MGRFYRTAEPKFIDFSLNLPKELMIEAVKFNDEMIAKSVDFLSNLASSLVGNALNENDRKVLESIFGYFNDEIDDITKQITNNAVNWRNYMPNIKNLSKEIFEEKTKGIWAKIENNYKQFHEWKSKLEELSKSSPEKFLPSDIDYLTKLALLNYKGVFSDSNINLMYDKNDKASFKEALQKNRSLATGTITTFAPYEYYDVIKKVDELGKGFEHDGSEYKYDTVSGQWIVKRGGKTEVVSEQEIITALQNALLADKKFIDYYTFDAMKNGKTNKKDINDYIENIIKEAVTFAAKKYGFKRISRFEELKVNEFELEKFRVGLKALEQSGGNLYGTGQFAFNVFGAGFKDYNDFADNLNKLRELRDNVNYLNGIQNDIFKLNGINITNKQNNINFDYEQYYNDLLNKNLNLLEKFKETRDVPVRGAIIKEQYINTEKIKNALNSNEYTDEQKLFLKMYLLKTQDNKINFNNLFKEDLPKSQKQLNAYHNILGQYTVMESVIQGYKNYYGITHKEAFNRLKDNSFFTVPMVAIGNDSPFKGIVNNMITDRGVIVVSPDAKLYLDGKIEENGKTKNVSEIINNGQIKQFTKTLGENELNSLIVVNYNGKDYKIILNDNGYLVNNIITTLSNQQNKTSYFVPLSPHNEKDMLLLGLMDYNYYYTLSTIGTLLNGINNTNFSRAGRPPDPVMNINGNIIHLEKTNNEINLVIKKNNGQEVAVISATDPQAAYKAADFITGYGIYNSIMSLEQNNSFNNSILKQ